MSGLDQCLTELGLDEPIRTQIVARATAMDDQLVAPLSELVRAALAIARDPTLAGTALVPILNAAETEGALDSAFAAGVASHLRATVAWRRDHNVLAASTYLNRSMEHLERDASDAADAYAGRVLDTMGQLLHFQGLLHDARRAFERALSTKERAGDGHGIALTQGNLGRLCMAVGDFEAATKHLKDDLAHVERHSPDASSIRCTLLTQIGAARYECGAFGEGRERLKRSLALAAKNQDTVSQAFALVHLARLELRAGRTAEADQHLRALSALDKQVVHDLPHVGGLAAQVHAGLSAKAGHFEDALVAFDTARAHFARAAQTTPIDRATLLAANADVAARSGNERLAADLTREALRELDATSADAMRARLDDKLKQLDRHAWMLHSSGRFVGHAEIARLLEEGGQSGFQGRSEEASVLFCDLRGFTSISERLSASRLVSTLNRYFQCMTRCVEHFRGRVDKFIGDAVMAFFPAGEDAMQHADRALHAALFMQEELRRFNRFLPKDIGPFDSGIGVHTGGVVAGLVGSPQRRSYTVLGDVVNTASRLEGMTKTLGVPILTTAEVARVLGEPLGRRLVPLGRYRPVGRRAYVEVYFMTIADDDTELARRADDALHRFYAREFHAAHALFEALADERRSQPAGQGYTLLAQAAGAYQDHPPPELWDGAVPLSEK